MARSTADRQAEAAVYRARSEQASARAQATAQKPEKITVKNLMTGKPVEIDADTPWCCNPASETYWSM